ncbi:DASS family sodium-coupled anion symporter [bacterium]|nr:DASS family sodium-coupled anion symporter [bacterium]
MKNHARANHVIIIISVLVFGIICFLPNPVNLSISGQRALGLFVMAIILWATNALPLSVTGLLIIALIPLTGILEASKAFALFGNRAVFFILGAFILAAAMMKSGLSHRISLLMLSKFNRSARTLIIGIIITCTLMAFIMPEHAVAAIMFPVVMIIARKLGLKPQQSKYGMILFLSMAWGSIIGGVATFLGGARNPLAIAFLKENTGLTIGFFEWFISIFPVVVILLIFAIIILFTFFKFESMDISSATQTIRDELDKIGKFKKIEKKVAFIVVVTVLCWVFISKEVGIAVIALLSTCLLFIFNVLKWEDVEDYVNWGVILMYGGAISLGAALVETGAAEWITSLFLHKTFLTPFLFIAAIALVSKIITEGISNSATVAILLPIAFAIGTKYNINPKVLVYAIAIPSGLTFMLPIGTPPNAIAYSSGYYLIKDVLKPGLIMNIVAWVMFLLVGSLYWPLIGISLIQK